MLRDGVYGNPHSVNPTSSAATALVEQARAAVLRYFNAPESEYACIFTPNATGAMRLVGEAYPFGTRRFLATVDNHNSVNGLREFARARGAATAYVPLEAPDLRVDDGSLEVTSTRPTGPQPLRLSRAVQLLGRQASAGVDRRWPTSVAGTCSWTAPRSRRRAGSTCPSWQPDFVAISFYKMFGYPTGLGALIARRRTLERLRRPWFSGGTVVAANVQGDMVVPHSGHAGFEDGTVDYLGIPAVEIGLRHLERIGIDTIAQRVESLGTLAARGAAAAAALRRQPRDPRLRAGDVGPPRGHDRVQLPAPGRARGRRAPRRPRRRRAQHLPPDGLLLQPRRRRGRVLDLEGDGSTARFEEGMILDDYIELVGMPTGGAVRVSLGIATNFADVSGSWPSAELANRTDVPTLTCRGGWPASRSC